MSDVDLLNRLKKGEQEAFRETFYRYYADLVIFSCNILKDKYAAEDVVQDFFIKFWQERKFMSVSSLKGYLFLSVKNASLNLIRDELSREKRNVGYSNEISRGLFEGHSVYDQQIEENKLERIKNSIEKLPDSRKRILVLCYYHNMKYREVAELLNISINTVKVQMGRALKFIKENSFFL
jgi:RNA polymerase sigma-70 factor, ECF subfamily